MGVRRWKIREDRKRRKRPGVEGGEEEKGQGTRQQREQKESKKMAFKMGIGMKRNHRRKRLRK